MTSSPFIISTAYQQDDIVPGQYPGKLLFILQITEVIIPFDSTPVITTQDKQYTPRNEIAKKKKKKPPSKKTKTTKAKTPTNLEAHWPKKSVCNTATTTDKEITSGHSKRERDAAESQPAEVRINCGDRYPTGVTAARDRTSSARVLLKTKYEGFLHVVKGDH